MTVPDPAHTVQTLVSVATVEELSGELTFADAEMTEVSSECPVKGPDRCHSRKNGSYHCKRLRFWTQYAMY